MGANYYVHTNMCNHCERYDRVHIGKSSAGWKFLVDVDRLYYTNFNEFIEFIRKNDGNIWDEYDRPISFDDLMDKIEAKKNGRSHCQEYPEDKYADDEIVDLHKGGFS